jgi:predicted negative regulator of RcsB-dependent stress response
LSAIESWCCCSNELIGRDEVLRQARSLVGTGPINLIGGAGVGTTVIAGAILLQLLDDGVVERVVTVALDPCTEGCDLVVSLGIGVGALMVGDETSVLDALTNGPKTAILLDDADLAPEAARHVVQLIPDVLWILTGRSPVTDIIIEVMPLPDEHMAALLPGGVDPKPYLGQPLLAALPATISPLSPFEGMIQTWPAMQLLMRVPMGTGTYRGVIDPLLARRMGERAVPRRSVREALALAPGGDPQVYATVLRERAVELHRAACDMELTVDALDLRMLRAAARCVADPILATLAAAAAARIHLRAYQASDALDIVRDRLQSGQLPRSARGLLRWIEGDALLTQGSNDLAHHSHLNAVNDLRIASGASAAAVLLARKCADAWAARDDATRARQWLTIARDELARHPDARALADTLRIAGNLATQAGEHVGAEALYDEALATLARVDGARMDRAFVRLGQVAVAMSRNNFAEAELLLSIAEEQASDHPVARAAVAWRRAELYLRRGQREEAEQDLERALSGFAQAGSLRGLRLCARMHGDLAAVQGDRDEAVRAWQQAMSLCVRTRNLAGLRRLLRRRLIVEREGLPGPHVDEIEQHLDLVEVLLQSPRTRPD